MHPWRTCDHPVHLPGREVLLQLERYDLEHLGLPLEQLIAVLQDAESDLGCSARQIGQLDVHKHDLDHVFPHVALARAQILA